VNIAPDSGGINSGGRKHPTILQINKIQEMDLHSIGANEGQLGCLKQAQPLFCENQKCKE
jgi:hypothetical protein